MNQSFIELLNKNRKTAITLSAALGVFLIGSIFFIMSSLTGPSETPLISLPKKIISTPTPSPTPIRAQMYASPLSIDTSVGKQFQETIIIDAKNKIINGIDSVMIFDPQYLKPILIAKNSATPKDFELMRKQIEDNKVIVTLVKAKTTQEITQELQ